MIWYEKWYFNLWPIMVHYSTFCRVFWYLYLFSQNRLNSKYRAVITSVNFLFQFLNNWSMLSAKLWANSVYSSLKIRFSHRDPDVPLENLEPLEPFQTHRSAQNLPEDISDEAMSIVKNILEPSLKGHVVRPHCQVHPRYDSSATSHMGKVILLMVSIFCPYLYLWPRGKHLSHTQVSDLFEILGHQILFTRHIPPYMASCSFQGSV